MKLLVLYQGQDAATDQPGYFDGFERLVTEGALERHRAIGYWGVAREHGWPAMWSEAEQVAREMEADAVLLQSFHGSDIPDPSAGIQRLKALSSNPMIITTLGDGYGRFVKKEPASFQTASALADLTFLTGMGYLARRLEKRGSRNIVLMPNGCCQVRFSAPPPVPSAGPEFDLVFIGTYVRTRNPFSPYLWVSRQRSRMVDACEKRYGNRFGLFGGGWQGKKSWQGPIAFGEQHAAYHRSALATGGVPHMTHDYYTSDREFIAIASGAPLVELEIPGISRLLESGRDWWLARDLDEMFRVCDEMLEMPAQERIALGAEARRRILEKHTQYHRCAEMVEIARSVREARECGKKAAEPELSFLAPARGDSLPAVVAWHG